MTINLNNPMRPWRDRPRGIEPEDHAAAMLRIAMVPGEPSPAQLARVERGVHERDRQGSRRPLLLRASVVALSLVLGAASVKAYELARRAGWMGPSQPTPAPVGQLTRPQRRSVRGAVTVPTKADATPLQAELPTQASAQASTQASTIEGPGVAQAAQAQSMQVPTAQASGRAPSTPSPVRRDHLAGRRVARLDAQAPAAAVSSNSDRPLEVAPAAQAEPPSMVSPGGAMAFPMAPSAFRPPAVAPTTKLSLPAPPAPSHATPVAEAQDLDRALLLLRRHHDAAAALPVLDAHLLRYPRGLLDREARLARVDALLMLRRADDALVALNSLPLDQGRRSTELQVIRAELRARNDCAGAESDFSAALAHGPDAKLLERILYGRGACRSKLGHRDEAASDVRQYLERFSQGVHAAWARQWLDDFDKKSNSGG